MPKTTIVLLSDIHIGINARTNWYQRTLHEPYLLAIFDHIGANATSIGELVILGDLVDQWTYLPGEQPPSVADIFAANPAIFGGVVGGRPVPGALAQAVAALEGRVTYVPGNHDMAITAADLARFADGAGRPIQLTTGPIYEPPAGRGKIGCAHGHMYSMFNAPDFSSDPMRGLPIGHFVTRLCALHAASLLRPDQTVANLRQSGDPTGTALLKDAFAEVVPAVLAGESLSQAVLDTFRRASGAAPDLEFVMLDGTRIPADVVGRAYENLFADWHDEARFPPSVYGHDPWLRALSGTDATNDLSHFAGVLGARYPVVVMGHTHVPVDEEEHVRVLESSVYANPGFNCPSKPDMDAGKGRVTFTEITIDDDARQLSVATRYVTDGEGGFRVAPEPLAPPRVVSMG